MHKVKTFLAIGLAATAVAVGGLASSPPATAMPDANLCHGLATKGKIAHDLGTIWFNLGNWSLAASYFGQATAYYDAATDCLRSLR
jgi:hypothetical protein